MSLAQVLMFSYCSISKWYTVVLNRSGRLEMQHANVAGHTMTLATGTPCIARYICRHAATSQQATITHSIPLQQSETQQTHTFGVS